MKKHFAYNAPFKMKDEKGNKYLLEIKQDDYPQNPREWEDNVTTMVCWHRHYDLGDNHSFNDSDEFFDYLLHYICEMDYEDFEHLSTREKYKLACENENVCIKELNLYDHSGITISTSNGYPYNDRWDAGCVGFVYVTKETAFNLLNEYVLDEKGERIKVEYKHPDGSITWGCKTRELTNDTWKKKAEETIDIDVEVYDYYLKGDVYGFELKEIIPVYGCGECNEEIDVNKLLSFDQLSLDEKVHYCCPHCGADLGNDVDVSFPLNIDIIEEEEEEINSCWDFYGCEIETNGILDFLTNLEFVD